MEEILRSLNLPGVWNELIQLIRNPNSNIIASLLLLSVIVIIVLLAASTVIALVTGQSRRRQRADREELEALLAVLDALDEAEGADEATQRADGRDQAPEARQTVHRVVVARPPLWQRLLLGSASAFAVGIVLLIAVGASSSSSAACSGCHQVTPHTEVVASGMDDPHDGVACVRCHESSGPVGIVTVESFDRVGHFFSGLQEEKPSSGYGTVRGSACNSCHRGAIREVTEDEVRGVRMSHTEPLEAGADCLDCHTGSTGIVSTVTNGMTPCLRCHDGENQPTDCATCHTKDVSEATTPVSSAPMEGRALITTPDCGSCHEQETQCDPCHAGVRMPHSELFMWWGHARQGAEDLWRNDGKACQRCHTEKRRPCTSCHTFMPGHPVDPWAQTHGAVGFTNGSAACDSCHGARAYVNNRDFCMLCHGEPVTQ